jgi:hypothetical protein
MTTLSQYIFETVFSVVATTLVFVAIVDGPIYPIAYIVLPAMTGLTVYLGLKTIQMMVQEKNG